MFCKNEKDCVMVSILEKIFSKKNELKYVFSQYQPAQMEDVINYSASNDDDMHVHLKDDMQIDRIYQSL